MQIRLTRKLADCLDGIDVSDARVGDVLEVSPHDGELLIAEGWAVAAGLPLPKRNRRTGERRHKAAVVADLHKAADSPGREVRTVERLREIRREMEQQRFEQQERRRAEDRIREELHDERSKTVK